MKIDLFVACDYAADYAGKLTLVGIFDSLGATQLPVLHPQLCVAVKLRFDDTEAGPKRARFSLSDADGREVLQPLDMPIAAPPAAETSFSIVNIVMNISAVRFDRYGEHSLDLAIDGAHVASAPLFIRPAPKTAPAP